MDFLVQNFDAIIKLGLASVAALAFFFALRNDILMLRGDINRLNDAQKALQEAFVQLGSILTKVAVQDARLNMLEKNLDELRHGHGIITER